MEFVVGEGHSLPPGPQALNVKVPHCPPSDWDAGGVGHAGQVCASGQTLNLQCSRFPSLRWGLMEAPTCGAGVLNESGCIST